MKLDTIVGKYFGEHAVRAAVQIVSGNHLIAGQQQLHHRIGSAHAA